MSRCWMVVPGWSSLGLLQAPGGRTAFFRTETQRMLLPVASQRLGHTGPMGAWDPMRRSCRRPNCAPEDGIGL